MFEREASLGELLVAVNGASNVAPARGSDGGGRASGVGDRLRLPERAGGFWARALRWDVRDAASDEVGLVPTDRTRFRLVFRTGAQDKVGQNPIHFDLTSTSIEDQQSSVAHVIASGAQPADVGQVGDEGHVVLADPEGNEFCVIEPGNRFLASCPRLGAVNCDGTKELGHFFSAILEWPLVWEHDEETAIQSPTGDGPKNHLERATLDGEISPRADPLACRPGIGHL